MDLLIIVHLALFASQVAEEKIRTGAASSECQVVCVITRHGWHAAFRTLVFALSAEAQAGTAVEVLLGIVDVAVASCSLSLGQRLPPPGDTLFVPNPAADSSGKLKRASSAETAHFAEMTRSAQQFVRAGTAQCHRFLKLFFVGEWIGRGRFPCFRCLVIGTFAQQLL